MPLIPSDEKLEVCPSPTKQSLPPVLYPPFDQLLPPVLKPPTGQLLPPPLRPPPLLPHPKLSLPSSPDENTTITTTRTAFPYSTS